MTQGNRKFEFEHLVAAISALPTKPSLLSTFPPYGKQVFQSVLCIFSYIRAKEVLDLPPAGLSKVAWPAKNLYGMIPAHALEEPRQSSKREKLKRALAIQIAILATLSGKGCHDVTWIMGALLELSQGLDELEGGFTPPVLRARKRRPDGPREAHYERRVKTTSVLAWERLCGLGVTKTKAAQMIADCITKHRFLPPRPPKYESVNARSIKNWARRPSSDRWMFDAMAFEYFRNKIQTKPEKVIADLKEILESSAKLES
jgi:hypothetical protein